MVQFVSKEQFWKAYELCSFHEVSESPNVLVRSIGNSIGCFSIKRCFHFVNARSSYAHNAEYDYRLEVVNNIIDHEFSQIAPQETVETKN